jgi:hypothetical protein
VNLLYVILITIISAVDGQVIEQYTDGEPVTLEQCNRTLIEKGPIPAHDGLAIVASCKRVDIV